MPNQDLLNYISQQRNLGVTDEQIQEVLVAQGWDPKQVQETMLPVTTNTNTTDTPSKPDILNILIFISLGILILTACAFAIKIFFFTEQPAPVSIGKETQETTFTKEEDPVFPPAPPEEVVDTQMSEYLQTCSPYELRYTDSDSGNEYSKKVIGKEENVCIYVETLPNKVIMECRFTTEQSQEIVQSINDPNISDPWESAVQDGTCTLIDNTRIETKPSLE